jgi:serine/threonine protein kinase
MEYMSGGHLGERMDEMGFDESLWTTVGIVRGIAHAHRRGRVHLDLKPSNILFDTDENWAVPRIADWGLSRSLINASNHSPPRTLLYAAPEQHRPEKYGGIDHRTDVYQLGLVLYEMLTGEFPFGQTPEEVMTGKLFDDPTRPSEVSDNNLPAVLDEPIMRSLSRSPEERYEMAQYLRDDLLQTINQI